MAKRCRSERYRLPVALWGALLAVVSCTQLLKDDGLTGGRADAGSMQDSGTPDTDTPETDAPVDGDGNEAPDGTEDVSPSCDPCQDPTLVRLPCRPDVADEQSGEPIVFAARTMRLGFSWDARDDWQNLGLDRDCLATTATGQPTSCKLTRPESGKDGLAGRDNSVGLNFGELAQFMKVAGLIETDVEKAVNADMERGHDGWTLTLEEYHGGSADPQVKVAFRLSDGAQGEDGGWKQAQWDGTDAWSYEPNSVTGSDDAPKYVDDNAFVVDDVLVAKLPAGMPFEVQTEKGPLTMHIVQLVVAARLSTDRQRIEDGMVSAVWPMTVARDQVVEFAMKYGLCPPDPRLALLLAQFEQASDIRIDLLPAPEVPCNGISFGMAFTAHVATLGTKTAPRPDQPNACGDAGADSGLSDATAD